jgi:hypothetical protein
LVSKLLQSISNGVLLDGSKEEYLSLPIFNDFITRNIDDVVALFNDLSAPPYSSVSKSLRRYLAQSYFLGETLASEGSGFASLHHIEQYVQTNFLGVLGLIPREAPLRYALSIYHAHFMPISLKTLVADAQVGLANAFVAKLPETFINTLANLASSHMDKSPNKSLNQMFSCNFNNPLPSQWASFHAQLAALYNCFLVTLKFWPSLELSETSRAERAKYLLSQLAFLHFLYKQTFASVPPTFYPSDMTIWTSLSNLLQHIIFLAADIAETDLISSQKTLLLGAMQLRWTASEIYGTYFS